MKKKKLLTTLLEVTAMLICMSMLMALGGCSSNSKGKKKDKKDSKYEDEDDEDEDEDDDESGDEDDDDKKDKDDGKKPSAKPTPKPSNKPNGQLSEAAPDKYDALTEADLHDTWVNENGTYMYFSTEENRLVDYMGTAYEIQEVFDNGAMLSVADTYYINDDTFYYSPLTTSFFFPMYLVDDVLYVGETQLYRATSDEGKAFVDAIEEEITDVEFKATTFDYYYEDTYITLKSDGYCSFTEDDEYEEDYYKWEYKDGVIYLTEPGWDETEIGFIYKTADDGYMLTSEYGDIIFLSKSNRRDANGLEGEYVFYVDGEDITGIATIEGYDGKLTTFDSKAVDDWDFGIEYSHWSINARIGKHVYEVYGYYSQFEIDLEDESLFLFPRNTIFGQLMLYREDVLNGKIDNIFIKDNYDFTSDNVRVQVEVNDYDSTTWDVESPSVDIIAKYLNDPYLASGSTVTILGPVVGIENCYQPVTVTYTVPKDLFESPDDLAVTGSYSYHALGIELIDDWSLEEDGKNYIVTFEADSLYDYMWYGITDCSTIDDLSQKRDAATILQQSVEDSVWGQFASTGDILDLVDLDYIADSIFDTNGSADFWVSTPAQLASATYYINELDTAYENFDVHFYIHLLNDIDLAGFTWAPIGQTYSDYHMSNIEAYYHQMRGIIFGNGYSIKNLSIDPDYRSSFIGATDTTTIIGLTLENPVYNGFSFEDFALISNVSWLTDAYDCKVIVDSETSEYLIFSTPHNSTVLYHDCTYVVVDDETGEIEETELPDDGLYSFIGNWAQQYYLREDGTYQYDAASEYKAYQADPTPFNNGTYYFANGDDSLEPFTSEKLAGYIYNNQLMSFTGHIAET